MAAKVSLNRLYLAGKVLPAHARNPGSNSYFYVFELLHGSLMFLLNNILQNYGAGCKAG